MRKFKIDFGGIMTTGWAVGGTFEWSNEWHGFYIYLGPKLLCIGSEEVK